MEEKTFFEFAEDFEAKLYERELEEASLTISYHYEDDVPVVDIFAELEDRGYVNSYRLEDVDVEEFEEVLYETWVETFEDYFESVVHYWLS